MRGAILLALLLAPTAHAQERPRRVAELAAAAVTSDGPGVAVGVIHRGKVVYRGGHGLADIGSRTPITPATVFDLASVSKQFTAAAILLLAADGKLALDDEARKHLPELPERRERPIRVRDLLHHTSGIRDYLDMPVMERWQDLDGPSVLEALRGEALRFRPGRRFEYSNSNYLLLAVIAERVARRPFAELLEARICGPLGMKSTVVLDRRGKAIPGRATGYARGRPWKRAVWDVPTTGDGNVFSSVDDLVLWDRALRDGKFGKGAFTSGKLDDGSEHGYGMGWLVDAERRVVSHGGGWIGTNTFIGRWLAEDLTVIALANASGEDGPDASDLAGEIAALYRWR